MKTLSLLSLLLLLQGTAEELRTWTSGKFTVEAAFLGTKDGKVLLKLPTGETQSIVLTKLSEEDQKYVIEREDNPTEPSPFETETEPGFTLVPKDVDDTNSVAAGGTMEIVRDVSPDTDTTPDITGQLRNVMFNIGKLPAFGSQAVFSGIRLYSTPDGVRVLAAANIKIDRAENNSTYKTSQTLLFFGNPKTGEVKQISVPQHITLLDVLPDGSKAIFHSGDWGFVQTGKRNTLFIASIKDGSVHVLSALTPFKNSSAADIAFGAFLNADTVLLKSEDRNVIALNITTGKVLWKTKAELSTTKPGLSAERKYVVLGDSNDIVLNALTGERLIKLNAGLRIGAFAFSPDGKTITAASNKMLYLWDAADGKAAEPFYIGTGGFITPLWTDNRFVLIGNTLIDTKMKSPVWSYNFGIHKPQYFGGYVWCLLENEFCLVPVKLPHSKALTAAEKPERFAVFPGADAALVLDKSVQDKRSEIETYYKKILQDNGINVKDDAPLKLVLNVSKEKEKSVYYVTGRGFLPFLPQFGRPIEKPDGAAEITFTPVKYSVEFTENDAVVWSETKTTETPDNIPLEDLKKSSILNVVNEALKKNKYADWFLNVRIPKQILRPSAAGFSSITVNGAE